jgi:hypothetical protein
MARPALRIEVTTKDQKVLRKLLSGGVQQVRVLLRAVALLQLAKGVSAPRVAAVVPLTPQAIRKVGHRYRQAGPERALYEKELAESGRSRNRDILTAMPRYQKNPRPEDPAPRKPSLESSDESRSHQDQGAAGVASWLELDVRPHSRPAQVRLQKELFHAVRDSGSTFRVANHRRGILEIHTGSSICGPTNYRNNRF